MEKSSIMLVFISSKHEPSAEGAAKILEKFVPQIEIKLNYAGIFFHLNRDLQPKAMQKYLKNLSHKWKKNRSMLPFFFFSNQFPTEKFSASGE